MKKSGIQVFEILPNGCLNGVYANEGSGNEIFNEIARKKKRQSKYFESSRDTIIGDYDCFYFDLDNKRRNCKLTIEAGANSHYIFKWFTLRGATIFTGEGWKTNDHQITIQYR